MLLRPLKVFGVFFTAQKACETTITRCPRFGTQQHPFHYSGHSGTACSVSYSSVASNSAGDNMASKSAKSVFDFETRYVKKGATNSLVEAENFFKMYDLKRKGFLDRADFSNLVATLFSHNQEPHDLTDEQKQTLFDQIDREKTGKISLAVFRGYWKKWFGPILDPVNALIVIDVQNDFISGSLAMHAGEAKHNGEEVLPIINKLIQNGHFDHVVYTRDWHPPDHISFHENRHKWKTTHDSPLKAEEANLFDTVIFDGDPPTSQVLWPVHCVQETEGAELHKDLLILKDGILHDKGLEPHAEYYSAFKDHSGTRRTSLADDLKKLNVTTVYTCGIAYDFCVGETSIDAVEEGFRTLLIDDAARGTSNKLIETMKKRLKKMSVPTVHSDEIADLVSGKDRRPELAFQKAVEEQKMSNGT